MVVVAVVTDRASVLKTNPRRRGVVSMGSVMVVVVVGVVWRVACFGKMGSAGVALILWRMWCGQCPLGTAKFQNYLW